MSLQAYLELQEQPTGTSGSSDVAAELSAVQQQLSQQAATTTELSRANSLTDPNPQVPSTGAPTVSAPGAAAISSAPSASSSTGLGITPTFIAPSVLATGSFSTAALGWTTESLPATVPSNAQFVILEYNVAMSAPSVVGIYARVSSVITQQRLMGTGGFGGAGANFGNPVALMPFNTSAMTIDFNIYNSVGAGATVTYTISVVGYWA